MFDRAWIQRRWYHFLQCVLRLATMLYFRVRYWGLNRIPEEGAVLMVSNHQSHLDPPLLGTALRRHMNYLARETLFAWKPFGMLLYSINVIPLDLGGSGLSGIKESLKRLKRGEMLMVFPEGTRTRDGEIARFKPGFTTLAVRSKAAIVPVAIDGAYQAWPRTGKFPMPYPIQVYYGEPIYPSQYAGMSERDLVDLVEKKVRECFAKLREKH